MKKMLSLVAAAIIVALGFGNVSYAADEKPENTFEVAASSKWVSQYVGDAGAVFYEGAVLHNELTVTHSSGLYLDVWGSNSFKKPAINGSYGNEFDLTLGRAWEMYGLNFDAGVAYFDLAGRSIFSGSLEGDIIQPFLQVNGEVTVSESNKLFPSIKFEYALPAIGNDPGLSGLHVHFALKHNAELSSTFSVSQKLTATYDDGAYGFDRALIGAYEIAPTVKLSEKLSLNGSILVIGPLTSVNDGRKAEVVGSIGISTTF